MEGFCAPEEKLFGPVQLYVAPIIVDAVKFKVCPVHIGELLPKVGGDGIPNTLTLIVPAGPVQPAAVAVTEYIPVASVEAPGIEGFWTVDVKLFGPVQLYVAPAIVEAVKLIVEPAHKVVVPPAVGAAGEGLMITFTVPAGPAQPVTVAVTEYTPAAKVVVAGIDGFCKVEEKELGPVQLYVAPAIVEAVKFKVWPSHNGELLPAVGAAGAGLIVTLTVPAGPAQPPTLAVTEYIPDAKVVTPGIEGFWTEEVKLFGPVQLYVAPATVEALKFKVCPAHNGALLPATGAPGTGFIMTLVVPARPVHPERVAVTEYTPAANVLAPGMEGFWRVETKLFGPVQL
jgi:formaldehyde-activating enzyme involved in methanogenesis